PCIPRRWRMAKRRRIRRKAHPSPVTVTSRTHLIPTSLELSRKNKECGSTLLSDAFEVDLCFSVVVFQLSVFSSRFSAYFGGIAGCVASGGGGSSTGLPSRRLSS